MSTVIDNILAQRGVAPISDMEDAMPEASHRLRGQQRLRLSNHPTNSPPPIT